MATDEHTGGKAKPAGVHGEIWRKIGEEAKDTKGTEYVDTAPVHLIKSSIVKQSKGRLYNYYLRWVNARNESGPWSDVISAVVG